MAQVVKRAHTAPTYITLEQAKAQCRFDEPAEAHPEDALMQSYIDAAFGYAEHYTGQEIIQKKFTVKGKSFADVLRFNKQIITEVEEIRYLDKDGSSQTVPADNYQLATVDTYENAIEFIEDFTFPEVQPYKFNAVEIDLTVGYAAADLPKNMRIALYMLIAHYYENRQDAVKVKPTAAENMLYQFKRH